MSLLLDTNLLIYHMQGVPAATEFLLQAIAEDSLNISLITKIEFLGWWKHTADGLMKCRMLIDQSNVFPISDLIADRAIELRMSGRIGVADAVVAATALVNNLKLATRNVRDFEGIRGLETINPING